MKLAWAHYVMPWRQGAARGYMNLRFNLHQQLQSLVDLEDCGLKSEPESPVVLHVIPPHKFVPTPNRINVVFSMWEAPTLPEKYAELIRPADGYIVPSLFCKKTWLKAGLKNTRVVPLGVDEKYLSVDPTRPLMFTDPYLMAARSPRPMRFLYVGSGQARKGWQLLGNAWRTAFSKGKVNAQLYIKTIAQSGSEQTFQDFYGGALIVDTRDLDTDEMAELYGSADVFVFPSFGEGFGLPPLEAMAAGCLVIASNQHGLAEFISMSTAVVLRKSKTATITYGESWQEMVHTDQDVADAMREVYDRWAEPIVQQRRRNGTTLAARFTWENSARQLVDALARKNYAKAKASKDNGSMLHTKRGKSTARNNTERRELPALRDVGHIPDKHHNQDGILSRGQQ